MSTPKYYRGGPSLAPRRMDVRFNRANGHVRPERGVSISARPDGLDRFGGAYEVGPLPADLTIIQIGNDPYHHEIIPAREMPLAEYDQLLGQVGLTRV